MYGLLLSSFADAIKETFGEEAWKQIREKAGVQYASFITHQVYSETLQPRLVNASTGILKQSADDVLMYQGTKFVEFCIKVGYDKFMRLLGRTISDFFNGLDNLHEYFRQYYPEMKRVSFIVSEESRNGLILHYRSKRKGYKMYVKGQILAVAKNLFNCEVKIEVKEERLMDETTFVAFDVFFDNVDYQKRTRPSSKVNRFGLQVKQDFLFSLFPFNIVFNRSMMITNVGNSLFEIMPDILNQPVDDIFKLVKPMASLTWETLVAYENNSFELETIDCLVPRRLSGETSSITSGGPIPDEDPNQKTTLGKLLLRGQMLLVDDWDQFMFICTPVLTNVKQMMKCCLYINDLSLHDSTRAAVLAGSQQNNQLAAALQKAKEQSASLQDTVKRVDLERNRIAKFLQEMMPKEVADRIKKGEPTLSMTQSHSAVSILFTHIVNFPAYINESKPMNVIELLNLLFSVYDQLVKTHNAYKVETVGDTYMVACGAPTKFDKHAEEAADLALHMLHVATFIIPPGHTSPIEIEIGIHSGPCSTGVVGSRCPRYCFFGDTVNTASRMCSYAGASKIQISSPTQQLLDPCGEYIFESRGKLSIKGKGDMNTYYLLGTRKCLQYLEQLKVIVIQCMGKQQENQFQQILGKRTLDSTESLLQEPNKTSMMAKRASGINAQAILKEEGRSNEGVKTKESVGSIPNSTPADDPHNTTKPGTPPMTKEESSILSKNNETSKQPNEADNVPEKCALKEDKMTVSGKMIRTETEVHVNRDNSKDTVDPKSKDGINEIKANGQCTGPNLEAEVKNEKHASPPNEVEQKSSSVGKTSKQTKEAKTANGSRNDDNKTPINESENATKIDDVKCPVELFNISTQTQAVDPNRTAATKSAGKKKGYGKNDQMSGANSMASSGRTSPTHDQHFLPGATHSYQFEGGFPGGINPGYLMQCPLMMMQGGGPGFGMGVGGGMGGAFGGDMPGGALGNWGLPMMSPEIHCPVFMMPHGAMSAQSGDFGGMMMGGGGYPMHAAGVPQNTVPDGRRRRNSDGKDSGRSTDSGREHSEFAGMQHSNSQQFVHMADPYGQQYVKLVPAQSALCNVL